MELYHIKPVFLATFGKFKDWPSLGSHGLELSSCCSEDGGYDSVLPQSPPLPRLLLQRGCVVITSLIIVTVLLFFLLWGNISPDPCFIQRW